ncbi:hypothetical protein, partial [Propioniciclava soli]|uniref:hypothetical protein n=1 Tax=Propioniciclava soli TaxID=2775081 RepID=UPI001E322B8E
MDPHAQGDLGFGNEDGSTVVFRKDAGHGRPDAASRDGIVRFARCGVDAQAHGVGRVEAHETFRLCGVGGCPIPQDGGQEGQQRKPERREPPPDAEAADTAGALAGLRAGFRPHAHFAA